MASARTPILAASLGVALGLVLGAAVGVRLAPESETPAAVANTGNAPAAASGDTRVAELEAEVARWRSAYEELARAQEEPEDAADEPAPDATAPAPGALPLPMGNQPFDTAALVARGYTEEEAQRLKDRYDAYQLDLLYLNDRAQRGGWRMEHRFGVESRSIIDKLHFELGDRDFDALLYGAGRNNRVRVAGVLTRSVAKGADLRDGDEIISYDGNRVYEAQTLLRATSQGRPGEQTEMVVKRDGQEVRVMLPRGPIGIRLQPVRVVPEGFM